MNKIIRSSERGYKNYGWLETFHSFSFSDYYDPEKINFGPIRVLNHDIIQPGQGFPKHPHKDMEIITVMIKGELAHSDSTGKSEVIRVNEVQKMSAGSGVYHSEFNNSKTELAELMQIWIFPNKEGLQPSYVQIKFSHEERKNKFLKIASNKIEDGKIHINQDAEIYLSELEKNKSISTEIPNGKGVYLYLIDGNISLGDLELNKGDALQITEANSLEIIAKENSSIIMFKVGM